MKDPKIKELEDKMAETWKAMQIAIKAHKKAQRRFYDYLAGLDLDP